MKKKLKKTQNKKGLIPSDIAAIVTFGSLISLFLGLIIYRISQSEKTLIHFGILALICGLVFEHKRISKNWKNILWTFGVSFLLSFLVFLPGKREKTYILENHIEVWPFAFLFFYFIGVISFHQKETTKKLTEGITLIHSMALIYWISDIDTSLTTNVFFKMILGICLIFFLFSFINAFTYFNLTRTNRLILSIGSSIIMVTFALDSIIKVFQNEEELNFIPQVIFLNLRFFLLGISSIYMANNLLMLVGFLPGKGSFFNEKYYRELQELKNDHVERYSSLQVNITDSFLCFIIVGGVFLYNYQYHILPLNFIIWVTMILFPLFLSLIHSFKRH
jgi:hypothetical protein